MLKYTRRSDSMKKMTFKTEPYIIKNKGYSTIDFEIIYPCKYSDDNSIYIPFLCQMLSTTSKKYNTEKKYREALFEKLIVSKRIYSVTFNTNTFIKFRLTLPDPKKLKGYDFEEGLKLFTEIIYNPNVENGLFNARCFNREKRYQENCIKDSKKEVSTRAYYSFLNIVDDKNLLKRSLYNNLEKFKKITNKRLYEKYEENILNNDPVVFIYGDVDKNIEELIKKYFKPKNKKISFVEDYSNYLIPFKKVKDIEEDSNYNQSILYMGYKVKDMKKEDEIYLTLIKNFLAHKPIDLVFKKLRMEKQLVYSSDVLSERRYGLLCISTYINNSSKDEVLKSIEEILEGLKSKEKLKEYRLEIINSMNNDLIRRKDSKYKKMYDFIDKRFNVSNTIEDLIIKFKNIDIDKLLDLLDRLTLDTIYFLKGEFNEKE